jgi:hypothetical protein
LHCPRGAPLCLKEACPVLCLRWASSFHQEHPLNHTAEVVARSLKQGSSPSQCAHQSGVFLVFFVVFWVIHDGVPASGESMLLQGDCFRLKVVDEELPIEKLEKEDGQCKGGNRWKVFKQKWMTKEQNQKAIHQTWKPGDWQFVGKCNTPNVQCSFVGQPQLFIVGMDFINVGMKLGCIRMSLAICNPSNQQVSCGLVGRGRQGQDSAFISLQFQLCSGSHALWQRIQVAQSQKRTRFWFSVSFLLAVLSSPHQFILLHKDNSLDVSKLVHVNGTKGFHF